MSNFPVHVIVTAIISLAALVVSLVTLWRTHFSRLRPIVVVGDLRHRIYPIKNGEEQWYLTSFDLPTSFCNAGAQPFLVTGMRIKLHFPDIPIPQNHEYMESKWDIEPEDVKKITKDRFNWLKEIGPRDCMPFVILPKSTVVKHVIFESRWDEPVIQNNIDVNLQIRTSVEQEWKNVAIWKLRLNSHNWVLLAKNGSSMGYKAMGAREAVEAIYPKDLHKYTGTKDAIPDTGKAIKRSYLNFPNDLERDA